MVNTMTRYDFEHNFLPSTFYSSSDLLISVLARNGIKTLTNTFFKGTGSPNPYKSDLDAEMVLNDEGITVIKITFPTPESEPLCYASFLLFEEDSDKLCFFTLERGNKDTLFIPFLCSWTKDGGHCNYGLISFDDKKIIEKCISIFKRM